jgi:PilZ domain
MPNNTAKERRKTPRIPLRWAVCLERPASGRQIRTETENFSSAGFYCVSPEPFSFGEKIECALRPLLPETPQYRDLRCRCTVVRSERIGGDLFGIAFRIDDYTVLSGTAS